MGAEETELVHDILRYLQLCRIPATRNQSGHINIGNRWINLGEPGWPDIIACLPPGRFLAIEAKRPGEEPTPHQRERLAELQAAGALCVVAHDIADVEKTIRGSK